MSNLDSIGLERGIVKLVPHNPDWNILFEAEEDLIRNTFGDIIIEIEHIGSTAIPGIPAKPIIDIDVGVKSLDDALKMQEGFKEIGYEYRPQEIAHEGQRWQELYVKGPEKKRDFYVHVTVYNSDHWKNDLLFRDFLGKNPSYAQEYASLKERLAKKYASNRYDYTEVKSEFIDKVLRLARIRK